MLCLVVLNWKFGGEKKGIQEIFEFYRFGTIDILAIVMSQKI